MESKSTETETKKDLRRVRKRRRKKHRSRSWRDSRFYRWLPDLLLVLVLVLAIVLLSNPFPAIAERLAQRGSGRLLSVINAFAHRGGAQAVGALLLTLSGLLGALRVRWRINHHQAWWARRCPDCDGKDLRRTPRKRRDRVLGAVGIPVRRYLCATCHWEGARVDESRVW